MRALLGHFPWVLPIILLGAITYTVAEDLTITTTYPAPRGVYRALQVRDRMAIGTTNPQAALEIVSTAQDATTPNSAIVQVSNAGATFNTFNGPITNFGALVSNTARNSSTANLLTNVGVSASASGADRNYGLLVPQGQVGIGTTAPDPSAILELNSTTQGFLPPRMSAYPDSPVAGLLIFKTNHYEYYDGTTWRSL